MTLFVSPRFAEIVAGEPLVMIDAGARDGLAWPWAEMDSASLRVLAFEPDAEECARLNSEAPPGVEFIPSALWSSDGQIKLHVARVPSCSSLHPPDGDLLSRYELVHRSPRETERIVSLPATTLDRVLSERNLRCDFLKLDTQGAELDILQGASLVLDQALGVLAETWTVPVHAGQGRTGAVLERLADQGLDVFDIGVAAAWDRAGERTLRLGGRRQVIGLDILALRDPPCEGSVDPVRLAKAAAIADAFGLFGVAASFLDSSSEDERLRGLREELMRDARRMIGRGPISRYRRRRSRRASLHD